MIKWTKKMSEEHKNLEKQLGAKNDFKLDFSDIAQNINNEKTFIFFNN